MRRHKLLASLVLLLLGPVVAFAQATSSPPTPPSAPPKGSKLIATSRRIFNIPFRIAPPAPGGAEPVEVQLHVSEDGGATWKLHSKVDPSRAGFTFQATHDGEYWFMVRTADREKHLRPAGPATPELRVLVDTVEPLLELEASRGPSGEIHAGWRISDTNLKPGSFKLEYQLAGAGDKWQPVAAEALGPDGKTNEVSWWPDERNVSIVVRAEVRDHASNHKACVFRVPDAPDEAIAPGIVSNDAAKTSNNAARPASVARPWPAAAHLAHKASTPAQAIAFPTDKSTEVLPAPTPDVNGALGAPTTTLISSAGSHLAAPTDEPSLGGSPMQSAPPTGVEPKMVNAKRFELEYDLESVGEAGIASVELWGTRDSGNTWTKMGMDDDSRSPIIATVEAEGLYGFTIVVESATGLRGATPRGGDAPEVWVGVDLTKPTANIVGVDQVQTATGELTIRWEASDAQLAARPITLAFAEQAGGPWQPIASGLENTGRYTWRLDHRVPDSVYIRIEVRDQAGNTATAVTSEPVTLDRVRPKGRIRDVRPTASSAHGPKRIINR